MPAALPPLPQPQDSPGVFLFSDEIIRELTDEETKHGIYTADRLPQAKREAVIQLLAEQRGVKDIARLVQVHQSTVTAVADRFGSEISDIRARLARKLRRVVWAQAERLERYPDMLPASSIPLAIKMLGEHAELLDGKATSRTEHLERVDIFADFPAFLASLETDAKNEALGIGDAGKKSALIAGRAADPPATIDVPAERVELDCTSSVSDPIYEASAPNIPGYSPALAEEEDTAGVPQAPAGGASAAPRPGESATDNYTQNFWPNGSFEEPMDE